MGELLDKYNLCGGASVWIQAIKSRRYAVVFLEPYHLAEPEIQYFNSRKLADEAMLAIVEADILDGIL